MTSEVLDHTEFADNGVNVRLIRKYAVILFIIFLIEIVLTLSTTFLLPIFQETIGLTRIQTAYMTTFMYFPRYIGNIFVAIVLYQDMKKTNTVSSSVVLLTLVFNEIGVAFFLIRLLYQDLAQRIENKRHVN